MPDGMPGEDILELAPPAADERVAYGADPFQFVDVRLPAGKKPHPVLLNIHGGYWRAKYDLAHAGHLCEALRVAGFATFNVEYRRVGNDGGGWPGTFADIRSAYQYVLQQGGRFRLDTKRVAVMGHSAGGQLALCLAAHEHSLQRAISLAGVVDLQKAFSLHLSHDAVVEFLGGRPSEVPDHYREADPMALKIAHARQWVLHGAHDDTVPPAFSRDYAAHKKKLGEHVEWVEEPHAGHFEFIDPRTGAFTRVLEAVASALR